MKAKTIFFVIIMLIVLRLSYAYDIVPTCTSCNRQIRTATDHAPNCPYYPKSSTSSQSSGGYSGYSGGSPQQQIQMMIFQSIFDSLLASPPDTSAQDEIARQNAIKRQQEEEQKKRAAIQEWIDLQNKEDLQRKMDQNAKIEQGEKLLSKTKTVGSGGELKPFSFGNPKLDIKSISQNTYPTTKLTTWERLLCSAYFSNLAKQSTKDVDARFYADQAQRVMVGEPTYLECKIPQVSNEKIVKRMKEVEKIYGDMNVKIQELQDIETKLTETREKIKDAEIKKEKADVKLAEIQNRAATASPEEKAEVDDLVRQAMEQDQIADQQLNQAKESEKDDLAKKEQLENELENMKSQMQATTQAGGK